jgi:SP family galactose:H+ symporter-like MFS transporter
MLNLPLAFVNAVGTGVSIFYIEKLGRRFILLKTLPFIFTACCLVSISMYLTNGEGGARVVIGDILAMVGLILYLAFFAVGWSSTVWSVNTEIYPIHLAGTGSALATATNWFSNFIVSSTFLSIMKSSNTGKVAAFLLLGGFCILAHFFVSRLLPETKGRRIDENVERILNR